jgi:hypothetical protein
VRCALDGAHLKHAHRVGHNRAVGPRVPQLDAGCSVVGLEHDQPFPQRVVVALACHAIISRYSPGVDVRNFLCSAASCRKKTGDWLTNSSSFRPHAEQ